MPKQRTIQSNSSNADINPNEDTTSNVEEEVEVSNMASQESYTNTSPKDVKGSGNNADINPITNTNTGDKSKEGHESHNNNTKAVLSLSIAPVLEMPMGTVTILTLKKGRVQHLLRMRVLIKTNMDTPDQYF